MQLHGGFPALAGALFIHLLGAYLLFSWDLRVPPSIPGQTQRIDITLTPAARQARLSLPEEEKWGIKDFLESEPFPLPTRKPLAPESRPQKNPVSRVSRERELSRDLIPSSREGTLSRQGHDDVLLMDDMMGLAGDEAELFLEETALQGESPSLWQENRESAADSHPQNRSPVLAWNIQKWNSPAAKQRAKESGKENPPRKVTEEPEEKPEIQGFSQLGVESIIADIKVLPAGIVIAVNIVKPATLPDEMEESIRTYLRQFRFNQLVKDSDEVMVGRIEFRLSRKDS